MLARERQGVGVGLRGLEACGQSVDMAGEDGGRREGVGQCGEVGRGGRSERVVEEGWWWGLARERQGVGVGLRGLEACGQSVELALRAISRFSSAEF